MQKEMGCLLLAHPPEPNHLGPQQNAALLACLVRPASWLDEQTGWQMCKWQTKGYRGAICYGQEWTDRPGDQTNSGNIYAFYTRPASEPVGLDQKANS